MKKSAKPKPLPKRQSANAKLRAAKLALRLKKLADTSSGSKDDPPPMSLKEKKVAAATKRKMGFFKASTLVWHELNLNRNNAGRALWKTRLEQLRLKDSNENPESPMVSPVTGKLQIKGIDASI